MSDDPEKKTILVIGGSLGARTVNDSIIGGLGKIAAETDVQVIWQSGKNYDERCREALKQSGATNVVQMVTVFIQTNHFREDLPQYDSGITVTLNTPANNTQEVVRAALRAFKACYKEGYQYKRAGVIVSGISKQNAIQLNLFDELTPEQRKKFNKISVNDKKVKITIETKNAEFLYSYKIDKSIERLFNNLYGKSYTIVFEEDITEETIYH